MKLIDSALQKGNETTRAKGDIELQFYSTYRC